jgi:hypothetical protein
LIGHGAVDVPLAALLLCAGALSLPILALGSEPGPPPSKRRPSEAKAPASEPKGVVVEAPPAVASVREG